MVQSAKVGGPRPSEKFVGDEGSILHQGAQLPPALLMLNPLCDQNQFFSYTKDFNCCNDSLCQYFIPRWLFVFILHDSRLHGSIFYIAPRHDCFF